VAEEEEVHITHILQVQLEEQEALEEEAAVIVMEVYALAEQAQLVREITEAKAEDNFIQVAVEELEVQVPTAHHSLMGDLEF